MATALAVKNGVTITMTRSGDPPVQRAFDGVLPLQARSRGLPIVTMASTLGGQTFVVNNPGIGLSLKTRVRLFPVVLLGAVVQTADGYVGTVGLAQCPSLPPIVG